MRFANPRLLLRRLALSVTLVGCVAGCIVEPNPSPFEPSAPPFSSEASDRQSNSESDAITALNDIWDDADTTDIVGINDVGERPEPSDSADVIPPLDLLTPDTSAGAACAVMSGLSSRLTRFEVVAPGTAPCDANSDGIVDGLDTQLNAQLDAVGALTELNGLLASAISTQDFVVIFDPRGWTGVYVKAILDVFDAAALQPECEDPEEPGPAEAGCGYFIPAESQNYNGCATTGVHGVEYGPAGTPMASVPANVLLTPPLFRLKSALLFRESRLQGTIDASGNIPAARWCGRLDMSELSAAVTEACANMGHPICTVLLESFDASDCEGLCTVTIQLETRAVAAIEKADPK